MSKELKEILATISNEKSKIADVVALLITHARVLEDHSGEFEQVYDAFTARWASSSYEKVLREVWAR